MALSKVTLLVIDAQQDFCSKNGSLYVQGAEKDMDNLGLMIKRCGNKIDEIHTTMDSHNIVDIAHPIWFVDNQGNHPKPFTQIRYEDFDNGVWMTKNPLCSKRTHDYLKSIYGIDPATNKTNPVLGHRYPHFIWPEHCIIGTEGHNLHPLYKDALLEWEFKQFKISNKVTKGSNPWTEHFSAIKAEVPDSKDPSTQINMGLINAIEQSNIVGVAGEALSHCVANTLRDMIESFSNKDFVKKLWLLTDATSNVSGFENLGTSFINDMKNLGMNFCSTKDFLN